MFNTIVDREIEKYSEEVSQDLVDENFMRDIDLGMSHLDIKFAYKVGLQRGLKISGKGFWGRACARQNIKRKKFSKLILELCEDLKKEEYTSIGRGSEFHVRMIEAFKGLVQK